MHQAEHVETPSLLMPLLALHWDSINALRRDEAWMALVRYWMSHDYYKPALVAAIHILRQKELDERSQSLANLLEDLVPRPMHVHQGAVELYSETLQHEERNTLGALMFLPISIWCDYSSRLPECDRERVLNDAIDACENIRIQAMAVTDDALAARFQTMRANGLYALGRLTEVGAALQDAIKLFRGMDPVLLATVSGCFARALKLEGRVQLELDRPQHASASLETCIRVLQDIQARNLTDESVHLAEAGHLNTLALLRCDRFTEAAAQLRKAADAYLRSLATSSGGIPSGLLELLRMAVPLSAMLSHSLAIDLLVTSSASYGLVCSGEKSDGAEDWSRLLTAAGYARILAGEHEQARLAFSLAIEKARLPSQHGGSVSARCLANALSGLSAAELCLTRARDAVSTARESISLLADLPATLDRDEMADRARLHFNYGAALSAVGLAEESNEAYRIAVDLFRQLAAETPAHYAISAACALHKLGRVECDMGNPGQGVSTCQTALAYLNALPANRNDAEPYAGLILSDLGYCWMKYGNIGKATECFLDAKDLLDQFGRTLPISFLAERRQVRMHLLELLNIEDPSRSHKYAVVSLDIAREACELAERECEALRHNVHKDYARLSALPCWTALLDASVRMHILTGDSAILQEAVLTIERRRAYRVREATQVRRSTTCAPPQMDAAVCADYRKAVYDQSLRLSYARDSQSAHAENFRFRGFSEAELHWDLSFRNIEHPSSAPEALRYYCECEESLQAEFDKWGGRGNGGVESPLSHRVAGAMEFQDIEAALPTDLNTVAVYIVPLSDRGVAVFLSADGLTALELPDVTLRYAKGLSTAWRLVYFGFSTDLADWPQPVAMLINDLTDRVVQPIVTHIRNSTRLAEARARRILLIPSSSLARFPFHACKLRDGQFLADVFDEVTYTPHLIDASGQVARPQVSPEAIAIANDVSSGLAFADVEAAVIARHFASAHCWDGRTPVRQWLLERASSCDIWHFSGHSHFDSIVPQSSALLLDTKEASYLTVQELLNTDQSSVPRVCILSGCESGGMGDDVLNEYLGFPAGLLQAGAEAVIAALWPVDELSAALLLDRMYIEWGRGQSMAGALSKAQAWLRCATGADLSEFVHASGFVDAVPFNRRALMRKVAADWHGLYSSTAPYSSPAYWSPFILVGSPSVVRRLSR